MKVKLICYTVLLTYWLISCYPNNGITPIPIQNNEYEWNIQSTSTLHPTSTLEFNRIVKASQTNTLTITRTPIILLGKGEIFAFTNKRAFELSYFDLDTGKIDNSKTGDIEFTMWCGTYCGPEMELFNGAYGFIFGETEPNYEDCAEDKHIRDPHITDKYICILTNSNNYSYIKINWPFEYRNDRWVMKFDYKVWKNN